MDAWRILKKTGLRVLPILPVLPILASAFLALEARAAEDSTMSFFITGVAIGQGGDLGGLAGADAHCQRLGDSVVPGKTWHAYLSTQPAGGAAAVNARDRIGAGPWYNANKVKIASSVAELHGVNNLNKSTALTHRGLTVTGRGDNPNRHDMLTGSHADGTAPAAGADSTCANWTSSAASPAKAMLGHHDRMGVAGNIDSTSWNQAHISNGCTQANLVATGGAGYFYCFAVGGAVGIRNEGSSPDARSQNGLDSKPYYLSADIGSRTGEVVYRFTLDRESQVEIAALDIRGRERALILRATRGPGVHEVRWNGTTGAGEPLPAGMYRLVFKREDVTGK